MVGSALASAGVVRHWRKMPVLIEDRGGIVALLLVSLFFHGTWPALLTLLERRGRLPQHTYLDYSITNLLAAVVMAFTLGQAGESTNGTEKFFSQLAQVSLSLLCSRRACSPFQCVTMEWKQYCGHGDILIWGRISYSKN